MPESSQVAVVTGSSSGIGAALARRMAARGIRVGLVALPGTGLEDVAAAIRSSGGIVATAEADLADRGASIAAIDHLTAELGPIDLLVLNAGMGGSSPVVTGLVEGGPLTSEYGARMERFIRVNLLGPVYALDAVLPKMIARGSGHIVGTSSLASYRGQPVFTGYCSSKVGLSVLLEGLRVELKPHGIDVSIVRPGFVKTPMTAKIPDRLLMDAEEAARVMDRGIAGRRKQINFPGKTAMLMSLVRNLPNPWYDRLARSMILKKTPGYGGPFRRASNAAEQPATGTH